MKTWRLIKSESFVLPRTKALEFAAKHAGLPHSPVERSLEKSRLQKIIGVIRNDFVLPFNWATVEFQGVTYRMNGQHSSSGIVEVGAECPETMAFHLDHFKADDRPGMVELFRQFDQRWSSRSSHDIAGAYQGLMTQLASCNKGLMKTSAEGVSWYLRAVMGAPAIPSGDETFTLFHREELVPFFVWINGVWNGRLELKHRQILAAMYGTHEMSESHASQFWTKVSFGPEFFTDDMEPGAVLIGELLRANEEPDFKEKEFREPGHYYRKAIKAWNAKCAGQRISSLKVSKGKAWPTISSPGDDWDDAA